MMSPLIHLHPQEKPKAPNSRMPYRHAVAWRPNLGGSDGIKPAVSIFVTQKAFLGFCAHALTDLYNEVGGWMLGKWRTDGRSGEQFIVIDTVLPALHTQHGNAFLTFTQDSQVALYNLIQTEYPKKDLVGWFHTHPRMGVFLSAYDTWLHDHFFPEIWQVALVIEPFSNTGGFFIRQPDSRLDPRKYFGFNELVYKKDRSVVDWRNYVTTPLMTEQES